MTPPADRPTRSDIERAAARLAGAIRSTPILTLDWGELANSSSTAQPVRAHLKLEFLQHAGSFKARGALHAAQCELDADPTLAERGLVAASGGNHGIAVAWAARHLGLPATVFVPTISAEAKVARLRELGADVHRVGAVYAEALAAARAHQVRTGAVAIHAYDQPEVVAGAGTVGRELDSARPGLDAVLVACGGGGLAGGLATWFGDSVDLVVCETPGTASFATALEHGGPVDVPVSGVAADALGATRLGSIGWRALRRATTHAVLVPDDDVIEAQQWLWRELRILVEPAAATPVAAIRSGRWQPAADQTDVAVVVCGANVDR